MSKKTGRPKTNTVQYFPHVCKHGKTIFILEQSFGNNGYAFWFKLLEMLGSAEGHYLDVSNIPDWEFLKAKTLTQDEEAKKMLDLLANLDAIDDELWGEKIIWSQNFVDNLGPVYSKRERNLPEKPTIGGVTDTETHKTGTESTRSKVEESKGKEREGEQQKNNVPFDAILDYWKQHKRLVDKCDMRAITKQRKEKVKARWQEQDFKNNWQSIVEKSNESDFLTGPEFPGFSFDWLIKNDTNYMKVLEGKYDNKGTKTHSQSDKRIEMLKKQSASYLNGGNNK